ncbi:MAG: RIP metalloprotease RseP [Syntrophomonadaceae bacterium]
MTILTNTLALVVVLSVLVVVHEFGHFALAKAFRFPVEVFSVGFGKRLFGRKWRGTDYRVSAIPLGGYVRVIGLGPDETTVTEGTSREAPPVGKRWQRALVLLAGPGMNFVLAILLHSAVFVVGVKVPAYELQPPVIRVVEPDSPGAAAGFEPGDRVVSINGTETPRWRDVLFIFGMSAREKLDVEVDRGGNGVFLHVVPRPNTKYELGYVGLLPDFGTSVKPRIGAVVAGSPAEKAGLKPGDVIVSVAGRPIQGSPDQIFSNFVGAVSSAAPGPFPVEFRRDGKILTARIAPRRDPDGSWKVGVQVGADLPEVLERFPFRQAFVEGWRRVRTDFNMTLSILGRLFRGRASMKSMSGPLDIAKFSGEAARTGAIPLVALMAAISLQLGIFNLLPIPVLDGGHLFLLGLESAARRDFSLRVKERILQVGFVMILALLAVVLYNDLAKNLPSGWWPFGSQ